MPAENVLDIRAKEQNQRQRAPLNWLDLAGKQPPARRWAIKTWIGYGHTTLLAGAPGIGKTLLGQQALAALSLPEPRAFVDEIPATARCLAWLCEDDHDEIWRRQVAIARWLDAGLEAFNENLTIIPRHGMENALVSSEFGKLLYTPLLEELSVQAEDLKAEVVLLDNVAQLFGINENDRHQVTASMNALSGALPGRAILLLAHPAKMAGSEFSGSTAWEAVVRTRLYLGERLPDEKPEADEPPQDGVRFLSRRKANYSNRDWRRFTFKDGVLVPDAVEAMGGIVGHLREQANEGIVIDGLRRLNEMKLWPAEGSNSPRFLPKMMAEHKLTDGRWKGELAQAMRRLMGDGKLVIADVAQYPNRTWMKGLKAT